MVAQETDAREFFCHAVYTGNKGKIIHEDEECSHTHTLRSTCAPADTGNGSCFMDLDWWWVEIPKSVRNPQ